MSSKHVFQIFGIKIDIEYSDILIRFFSKSTIENFIKFKLAHIFKKLNQIQISNYLNIIINPLCISYNKNIDKVNLNVIIILFLFKHKLVEFKILNKFQIQPNQNMYFFCSDPYVTKLKNIITSLT